MDRAAEAAEGRPLMNADEQPLTQSRPSPPAGPTGASSPQSANLADLLERVLDKGIVIAGDITLSLGTIELLTLRIRLLIASVDKAEQIGIDWWRTDPALSSQAKREQLEDRVKRLEARLGGEIRDEEGAPEDDRALLEERLKRLEARLGSGAEGDQESNDGR